MKPMRERRTSDWVVDLNGRHVIEAEVGQALEKQPGLRLLQTSTSAFDRLDFQLLGPGERLVELEVKAKHQPLSAGWRAIRPDVDPSNLFVIDELALRKILDAGRYTFLLVRDVPRSRWVLWSAGDLVVATRVRCTRRLEKGQLSKMKGKLLFDLTEAGFSSSSLAATVETMADTVTRLDGWWADISPWPATGAIR
jgi:hypothetical protein